MTKDEFLKIIEFADDSVILSYAGDPDFRAFAKEWREKFKQERENQTNEITKYRQNVKNSITELIEKNKDIEPNVKELTITKYNDSDLYEDNIDDFDSPETSQGNILICSYNIDNTELKVKGMYRGVKAINFGNEYVFVTDGETFNAIGDEDNTSGAKTLNELLSYIDSDVLDTSVKIDKNVFNTGADYFVMISEY